ncbi:MAG TPA: 3-phosphoglycerate dehydrogenase, partial [Bacillota bacterium]|nr:3-phosphoglycerate dehydrogenase [Bacillota bacterium]
FNHRITLSHLNIPNMVGQITGILASKGLNIENMINKSRDKVAYTIIDTDTDIPDDILGKLENIDSMIRVRKL